MKLGKIVALYVGKFRKCMCTRTGTSIFPKYVLRRNRYRYFDIVRYKFFNIILDKILAPYISAFPKYGYSRNRYKYFDIVRI